MDGKLNGSGVDNLACWIDEDDRVTSPHSPGSLVARNKVISPVDQQRVIKNEDPDGVSQQPEKITMDFDDILPHVGEFGTYQVILFFLTAPFCFFLAFSYFSQVFITLVPLHTCHVPELNQSGLNITQK